MSSQPSVEDLGTLLVGFSSPVMHVNTSPRMGTLTASLRAVRVLWRGSIDNRDTYFEEKDDLSTLTSILNDYACKGKAWSDKLPAGLMRDASKMDEEEG